MDLVLDGCWYILKTKKKKNDIVRRVSTAGGMSGAHKVYAGCVSAPMPVRTSIPQSIYNNFKERSAQQQPAATKVLSFGFNLLLLYLIFYIRTIARHTHTRIGVVEHSKFGVATGRRVVCGGRFMGFIWVIYLLWRICSRFKFCRTIATKTEIFKSLKHLWIWWHWKSDSENIPLRCSNKPTRGNRDSIGFFVDYYYLSISNSNNSQIINFVISRNCQEKWWFIPFSLLTIGSHLLEHCIWVHIENELMASVVVKRRMNGKNILFTVKRTNMYINTHTQQMTNNDVCPNVFLPFFLFLFVENSRFRLGAFVPIFEY